MILILGGTAEGRHLAEGLAGRDAVLSLAGRTRAPLTAGEVRIGGFGGVDGLRGYLRGRGVTAVVNATHPFAARMSRNAAEACAAEGIALLRLLRPSWASHPLASTWHWVDGHGDAARLAATLGARPLLTVGRQHTADYVTDLADRDVVARVAEPPIAFLPARWTLLTSRGPFTVDGERELMAAHGIDVLVTKDAGGAHTDAKLGVAAERGAAVVMIWRPASPEGVPEAADVAGALAWLG
ncbi:cobalt-precorrin-6A reductase [Tessaracoccus sp. G1721]